MTPVLRLPRVLLVAFMAAMVSASSLLPLPPLPAFTGDIPAPSLQEDLDGVRALLVEARDTKEFAKAGRLLLEARAAILSIMEKIGDPIVRKEFGIPELAARVEKERKEFLRKNVSVEFRARVRRLLQARAEVRKVEIIPPGATPAERERLLLQGTFREAVRELNREGQNVWQSILDDLGSAGDEEFLKRELLTAWEERDKRVVEDSDYGGGTILVAGDASNPGTRNMAEVTEQWWAGAELKERTDWLLSWFAERFGYFETVRTWDDPCTACKGKGGACGTCNGAGVRRHVKWR